MEDAPNRSIRLPLKLLTTEAKMMKNNIKLRFLQIHKVVLQALKKGQITYF